MSEEAVKNVRPLSLAAQSPGFRGRTGFDADLVVRADARSLHRVHLGRLDYVKAVQGGHIELDGPSALVKAFPTWMEWSRFAETVRKSARP